MTGDAASILVLDGVRKSFGSVVAVDTVDLSVARGEFFALLGPSGCGKTTLMRLVAGFETADAGRIMIDGVDVTRVPPYRRPVNMMFQSYALFPHMSVERNIAFGLVQERMPRRDIRARVDEMLHLVQLEGYGKRRPSQLSGGQKQRVALARALAKKPKLLLLDEPLAALDRKLREETQFELMRVQRELGLGFVVVTHDQDEAMIMAQRIAVMRAGRFEQVAPPRDVYDRPAARWVADFIGEINLLDGTVASVDGALAVVEEDSGARLSVVVESAWTPGDRVTVAVRPERMRLAAGEASPINAMSGRLVETAFRGDTTHWRIARPNGAILRMSQPNMADPSGLVRGDAVVASFAPDAARVLSR